MLDGRQIDRVSHEIGTRGFSVVEDVIDAGQVARLRAALLRAIEARTVKRIGSNDWRKVDVRVVTATHQDLARLCNQRLFREDLYFRLAVVKLGVTGATVHRKNRRKQLSPIGAST